MAPIQKLLKKGPPSHLKAEPYMMESGKGTFVKAVENKHGQMGLVMKECGKITKPTVKEPSGILMEIFLVESGRKIKPMAMESTLI